ncbi:MAG: phenylacetic acid degradation protein [Anaerolineae bacterium]|nr:phenylacetic acid degradation protein [Anaerolineae bacterium]
MSDTQWPRWEVFKQDAPNKPHQAVGSVHAADPEHALLNARNVFVRRPQAVSLWVVRAEEVFSMTAEELAENPEWAGEQVPPDATAQSYTIFRRASHRRAMTFVDYVGEVDAVSPKQALQRAIATFSDQPALAWWVVPTGAIVRSEPDVVDSWFAPALTKTYKQQSKYGFVRPEPKED